MTDAIKSWCEKHDCTEKITGYSVYCSDMLNVYLFGVKSAQLKTDRGVSAKGSLRDHLTSKELWLVDKIEDRVCLMVDMMDVKPTEAIKLIVEAGVRNV
jgi:hypothetical protein